MNIFKPKNLKINSLKISELLNKNANVNFNNKKYVFQQLERYYENSIIASISSAYSSTKSFTAFFPAESSRLCHTDRFMKTLPPCIIIFNPDEANLSVVRFVTSSPLKKTVPFLYGRRLTRARPKVDLPEPGRPMTRYSLTVFFSIFHSPLLIDDGTLCLFILNEIYIRILFHLQKHFMCVTFYQKI